MHLRRTIALTLTLVTGFAVRGVEAQDAALLVEAYGGVTVPTGSFADGTRRGEGVASDAAFTLLFALPGAGRRTIYAGFTQSRFGCEDAGCGTGDRYVATGFNLGLRFALLQGHSAVPWIRLGGITTRVETDGLPDLNAGLSDLGFGGEVGVGVHIGAASPVALVPTIVYSAVNSTLPAGDVLRMRHWTAQIALALAF